MQWAVPVLVGDVDVRAECDQRHGGVDIVKLRGDVQRSQLAGASAQLQGERSLLGDGAEDLNAVRLHVPARQKCLLKSAYWTMRALTGYAGGHKPSALCACHLRIPLVSNFVFYAQPIFLLALSRIWPSDVLRLRPQTLRSCSGP